MFEKFGITFVANGSWLIFNCDWLFCSMGNGRELSWRIEIGGLIIGNVSFVCEGFVNEGKELVRIFKFTF